MCKLFCLGSVFGRYTSVVIVRVGGYTLNEMLSTQNYVTARQYVIATVLSITNNII